MFRIDINIGDLSFSLARRTAFTPGFGAANAARGESANIIQEDLRNFDEALTGIKDGRLEPPVSVPYALTSMQKQTAEMTNSFLGMAHHSLFAVYGYDYFHEDGVAVGREAIDSAVRFVAHLPDNVGIERDLKIVQQELAVPVKQRKLLGGIVTITTRDDNAVRRDPKTVNDPAPQPQ